MSRATLDAVLGLEPRPAHVSAYALTVEPGHAPGPGPGAPSRRRRHGAALRVVDDARWSAAGYRWYEVSNWAMPGHECRHNTLYWAQGDYRGIGCAAHSHRGRRRWWNIRTPERYIEARALRQPAPPRPTSCSPTSRLAFEGLALALRTSVGVPASVVPDDPDLDGLSSATATGPCSRCGAGCSPTRSRCACACPRRSGPAGVAGNLVA